VREIRELSVDRFQNCSISILLQLDFAQERSKVHVLPDVRWPESVVTPFLDMVGPAQLMFGVVTAQPPSTLLLSCAK
jgi:hypothetical protein